MFINNKIEARAYLKETKEDWVSLTFADPFAHTISIRVETAKALIEDLPIIKVHGIYLHPVHEPYIGSAKTELNPCGEIALPAEDLSMLKGKGYKTIEEL